MNDTIDSDYFDSESNLDYLAERLPGEHVIQYCWRSIMEHLQSQYNENDSNG